MPQTILVVDGDPVFLARVTAALSGAGYTVLQARGSEEALLMMRRPPDDLAAGIVDLCLPGQSGYELLVRLSRAFPGLPLIAMSAVHKEPYLSVALACGAQWAVSKPAADAQWPAIVERALKTETGPEPDGTEARPLQRSVRRYLSFRPRR